MNKLMMGGVFLATALAAAPTTAHAKGGTATTTAAADLKWADVPGFAGVHMAVADGDPAKGAAHFFMKFDKGFAAPEHHHTADHFVTVLSGTMVLGIDGKDVRLPAGSFFEFKGKKPHTTTCDAAADCLIFIDARGKWDVVPEAAAKPADAAKKPADATKKPADTTKKP